MAAAAGALAARPESLRGLQAPAAAGTAGETDMMIKKTVLPCSTLVRQALGGCGGDSRGRGTLLPCSTQGLGWAALPEDQALRVTVWRPACKN